MTALYTIAETRAIEQSAMAVLPPHTLMERAGRAAAQHALELLSGDKHSASVLVLAGPGNNGGDALEVAHHLANAGFRVTILSYAHAEKQPEDAKWALMRAQRSPALFRDASVVNSTNWSLIIDGLFGIGLSKPITGEFETLVETINQMKCPILALDAPSGLNVDTGALIGEAGVAIHASHTITFIAGKPGLFTRQGRDHAGEVTVAPLDIESSHYPAPSCWLNEVSQFSRSLKQRPHDSHKGSYGIVAIVGGAHGMAGAVVLAGRVALQSGAGRVYAVFLQDTPAYDGKQPELMCRDAHDFDLNAATLVVGPGIGQSRGAHDLLAQALNVRHPIVLDADALNLIAAEPGLQHRVKHRREPTLMTPHPLEAARLLGISSQQVQADRLATARRLAHEFNATVILKGSGSVITEPDGNAYINPTGNPALSTAGSGDVLAGICGALLAQRWPVRDAALGACWVHGKAADVLVSQGIGPVGLTASELMPVVRTLLNQLTAEFG
jgi:hydroxyethylthiazole kinase-like uncharacterized protein yjeF